MLSLIERGEANPTWNTVHGIAAALGVSMADLAKAAEKAGQVGGGKQEANDA